MACYQHGNVHVVPLGYNKEFLPGKLLRGISNCTLVSCYAVPSTETGDGAARGRLTKMACA
eukprot:3618157-Rhodomonas_salina.2